MRSLLFYLLINSIIWRPQNPDQKGKRYPFPASLPKRAGTQIERRNIWTKIIHACSLHAANGTQKTAGGENIFPAFFISSPETRPSMIQHHTGTFSKGIHHSFHSLLSSSSLHFSHIFSRMIPASCPAHILWHAKTLANGGGHPLLSVCACLKASYHILLCCNIFYVDPNITEKEALTRFGIPPIAAIRETGSFSYSS